jgi:hypothetical protein
MHETVAAGTEKLSIPHFTTRVARFFLLQNTNTGKNIPNYRKIYPMAIEYSKIFHSNTLQNLPKLGFLVSKRTIWQPCLQQVSAFLQQPQNVLTNFYQTPRKLLQLLFRCFFNPCSRNAKLNLLKV